MVFIDPMNSARNPQKKTFLLGNVQNALLIRKLGM